MQWQGIIVEGNPTQAQTYSSTTGRYTNQGYVISNGGKILNAQTAISIGNADGTMGGGVAVVDYVIFRNNHTGVKLQSSNTNNSLNNCAVRGCNFDNQYPVKNGVAYQAPRTHIMLKDIKTFAVTAGGGNIANNIFNSNISNNWADNTSKGTGVLSYNSNVALDNNNFGTLLYGVDIYNTATLLNTFIKNNRFSYTPTGGTTRYTTHGIKIEGGAYANINKNTFTIPQDGKGIDSKLHTNALITENTFTNAGSTISTGVLATDNTTGLSEVYKNTFNNLKQYAVESKQNNTGLKIDCNTFAGNKIDINVTNGNLRIQGDCDVNTQENPSANLFTTPCGTGGIMNIILGMNVPNVNYRKFNNYTLSSSCAPSVVIQNCTENFDPTFHCLTKLTTGGGTANRTANNNMRTAEQDENIRIRQLLEANNIAEAYNELIRTNTESAMYNLMRQNITNPEASNYARSMDKKKKNKEKWLQLCTDTQSPEYINTLQALSIEQLYNTYPDTNEINIEIQVLYANLNKVQLLKRGGASSNNVKIESSNANEDKTLSPGLTLSVFPNPSHTNFTIVSNSDEVLDLEVIDNAGKIIQKNNFTGTTVFGDNLSKGFYFIKISNAQNKIFFKKIIKI